MNNSQHLDKSMTKKLTVVVAAILAGSFFPGSLYKADGMLINNCTVIDVPGHYFLARDIINSTEPACIRITSDSVILDGRGYRIDGVSAKWSTGVIVSGSQKIENVTITNLTVLDWYYGIHIENATKSKVEHVTVSNNGPYGIHVVNSTYINISHSILTDNGAGICIDQNSLFNKISHNAIYDNLDAIYILNSDRNTVFNNSITQNWGGLWIHNSNDNLIYKNEIRDCGDAIWVTFSSSNVIRDNIILDNDGGILIFNHSFYNTITGNVIKNNRYGINLSDYTYSNFIYNNLFNNTVNVFLADSGFNIWNGTLSSRENIAGGMFTGGNFWTHPNGSGFSVTCSDENSDGICDSPYILNQENIDYLPLALPQPAIETVPDNVDDTKEQIVSKYNPSFDWSTQTPSRNDVLQAVVNAVIAYFSAQDDAAKQNILSDVVQMVILYFSLRS